MAPNDLQSQYQQLLSQNLIQSQQPTGIENEVELSKRTPNQVCVSVPSVYVNKNENGEHKCGNNLFLIDHDLLNSFVDIAFRIETGMVNDQVDLHNKILSMSNFGDNAVVQAIVKVVSSFSEIQNSLDVDEDFYDISIKPIEFDSLRSYTNDPETGLLTHIDDTIVIDNCMFYTQFGNDVEKKNKIRQMNNDTDLNRIYYILKMMEDSIAFKSNRIASSSTKFTNICMFYILIIQNGVPVKGKCSKYLSHNIMGFMADVFIRSRVLTHWQNDTCRNQLLKELITNYNKDNLMVALCKIKKPEDRSKYVLQYIQQNDLQMYNSIKSLNYKAYINVLSDFEITIDNESYYYFTSEFTTKLMTMQGISNLIAMYK